MDIFGNSNHKNETGTPEVFDIRHIPFLLEYRNWIKEILSDNTASTDGNTAYAILFDDACEVKQVLLGDDAKALLQEQHKSGSTGPSFIFYDPYDMPEYFYWGYYSLDIYSALEFHNIVSKGELGGKRIPGSWGSKF
ncbi:hypothetical protein ACFLTB_02250 [Chloroflexota bacterium]